MDSLHGRGYYSSTVQQPERVPLLFFQRTGKREKADVGYAYRQLRRLVCRPSCQHLCLELRDHQSASCMGVTSEVVAEVVPELWFRGS
jgi:hypothetical protein